MKAKELLDVLKEHLATKTRTNNTDMFENLISHYICTIASMMRAKIEYLGEELPINQYSLILADSGVGKNVSVNFLDKHIGTPFHDKFKVDIQNVCFNHNVARLAAKIARETGIDGNEVIQDLQNEFLASGGIPFSFASATLPAVRQYHRLGIICNSGSLNLVADEIGMALNELKEALPAFLTLFDKGNLDQKLLKGSYQAKAQVPVVGQVPANMLLFGTPSYLLDAGINEKEIKAQFAAGYARRLICTYIDSSDRRLLTPEEIYEKALEANTHNNLTEVSEHFKNAARPDMFKKVVKSSKGIALQVLEYEQECQEKAKDFSSYKANTGEKAEMLNRAYKTIKLAGAFAFIENSDEVLQEHFDIAKGIIENSGESFNKIINSKKDWERLVDYLVDKKEDTTHDDMLKDLPFMQYKSRKDIIDLAIAYGYKHNIVIERSIENGIEFLKASKLEETNIDQILISYSKGISEGYEKVIVPFSDLHKLTTNSLYNYTTHGFAKGVRDTENVNTHFNLVVLDVDGTVPIVEVEKLLHEYTYHIYTTKSHTKESNRFRLLLPISHHLELSGEDHKEFMENIYNWLPFEVDNQTKDRARKWASNSGSYSYNSGKFLDATKFIPRTNKAKAQQEQYLNNSSLDNLQRWCIENSDNNRNNCAMRYALALVDSGKPEKEIEASIKELNRQFKPPLKQDELNNTILTTVRKKLMQKNGDKNVH